MTALNINPGMVLDGVEGGLRIGTCLVLRPLLRRYYLHWGTREDEARCALPGDEQVPDPNWRFTHAVAIEASPEQIWPWIVQVGFKRAGWYSYDLLEALPGAADFVDGRSADRIIPELQSLRVGDRVYQDPRGNYIVTELEPARLLLFSAHADMAANKDFLPGNPLPENYLMMSWVFLLRPDSPKRTRLITRFQTRFADNRMNRMTLGVPTEVISANMSWKMLAGIKRRAEASAR